MPNITNEQAFETAIEQSLTTSGGYMKGDSKEYIPSLGMFRTDVINFFKTITTKEME